MEILVSMMIMAICLTVIMNLFSGGLKSRARSSAHNIAVDLANNKMQEVLLGGTYEVGYEEGKFENGYFWTVEINKSIDEDQQYGSVKTGKEVIIPWDVVVEVRWTQVEKEKKHSIQTMVLDEM